MARAPWSVVEDVTFRNNVVRHVAAGFNILGRDDIQESRQTRRIAIHNNLLSDVGGKWGGNGRLFQLLDGTAGVSITHNTAERTTGGVVFGGDHDPHHGLRLSEQRDAGQRRRLRRIGHRRRAGPRSIGTFQARSSPATCFSAGSPTSIRSTISSRATGGTRVVPAPTCVR